MLFLKMVYLPTYLIRGSIEKCPKTIELLNIPSNTSSLYRYVNRIIEEKEKLVPRTWLHLCAICVDLTALISLQISP